MNRADFLEQIRCDFTAHNFNQVVILADDMSREMERLRIALADAIRRPMGIVPASAEGLVTREELDAAEDRRSRIPYNVNVLEGGEKKYGSS